MKKFSLVLALCMSVFAYGAHAAEGYSYYNDNFSVSVNNYGQNRGHRGPVHMPHQHHGHMPPPPHCFSHMPPPPHRFGHMPPPRRNHHGHRDWRHHW